MRVNAREYQVVNVRLRLDVISESMENPIEDLSFLQYRLAGVEEAPDIKLEKPDIIWYLDTKSVDITYNNEDKTLTLYGRLPTGDVLKLMLAMLVRKLQEKGIYNFHASAVNYLGRNIMFMAGEENHGKTMGLIEAVRRGGSIIGAESVLVDENLNILKGTKEVFLTRRVRGTERTDLPPAHHGVWKFFDKLPEWRWIENPGKLDLIILPDIDGHYDTFVTKLETYEKMYQTFICLTETFFMMHYMLSSNKPFPIMDYKELRERRLSFVRKIADTLDIYLIRAKTPQILIDEIEKILKK